MNRRKFILTIAALSIVLIILLLVAYTIDKRQTKGAVNPSPTISPAIIPSIPAADNIASASDDVYKTQMDYQRQYIPDVYLVNKILERTERKQWNEGYTVLYSYQPQKDTYDFIIDTGNNTQLKQTALAWIRSTGLTDSQINTFTIIYK